MTHTQRSWTDDEGPLPCAKCGAPEVVMDWGDMNELLGEQRRGQWLHTGLCEACGMAEKERVERQRNSDRAEAALGAVRSALRAMYSQSGAYNKDLDGNTIANGSSPTNLPGIDAGDLNGRYFSQGDYTLTAVAADSYTVTATGTGEVEDVTITLDQTGAFKRSGI